MINVLIIYVFFHNMLFNYMSLRMTYYSVEASWVTNYTDLLSIWMCCDFFILPVHIDSKSLLRESLKLRQKHEMFAN